MATESLGGELSVVSGFVALERYLWLTNSVAASGSDLLHKWGVREPRVCSEGSLGNWTPSPTPDFFESTTARVAQHKCM